ncbi:MAG TPA: hypothetical protein DEG17_05690 [Cyanobacteria bacterium UBA11149]|nr:hypothetical protein [Cyanobacteria bacterium UBA11366]HBR72164.1 hypothetical protein [Cyanobacteria bacterium UBA11159]HBS71016.1 hypothetical protein [Cyanobacteria bacterium UBA11153]HBW88370.1 hypothetical protein [Cyanobacteria bacterium UBA11149]HCA98011.1 hypothetical protein [Cyanobacteria bacterium UBA9226]
MEILADIELERSNYFLGAHLSHHDSSISRFCQADTRENLNRGNITPNPPQANPQKPFAPFALKINQTHPTN